jgi:hypothetical protein
MMSYLNELLRNAPVGHNFTVHCDVDELYDAWRESGRTDTCEILVVPCHITGGFDVRIVLVDVPEHDEYSGDVVQVAVAIAGICAVFYVFIGWVML